MPAPLVEVLVVLGLIWLWAGVLWFLPAPAPRVELVERDEEERDEEERG